MNHAQITLDKQSITTLEELETILKLPRAKIIREALTQLKTKFIHTIASKEETPSYKHFDKLVGSIKLKTDKPTNFSQRHDSFYLKD